MSTTINALTLSTAFATFLLGSVCHATAEQTVPRSQVTFLTWGDYIDKDLVEEFEDAYNTRVRFVYFESDDARDEILTTSGSEQFDLMLVDSVSIPFYETLGWIKGFKRNLVPNLNHLELPSSTGLNQRGSHCAAYAWGTTGIAYRKDLVPEPITSWRQIFKPSPELKGRILMSSMADEVVGMALKSLGYSMASTNQDEIEEARQLLVAQAPAVAGYSAIAVNVNTAKLVTGEISASLTYSGDALMLKEVEPKIEYVVPQEGGAVWADFICLSNNGPNPELAHRFVNFINQPEHAAQNALYFYSATPNKMAEKLLPEEFLANPVVYPEKEVIERSELYRPLNQPAMKEYILIMEELHKLIKPSPL